MEQPAWLPALLDTDGVWEEVISRLYRVFEKDFILDQCHFNDRLIIWDQRKLVGKYDEGFWHLITKLDNSIGDRFLDTPRARRLPWCKPTIENSTDNFIKVWEFLESSGRVKTYIWLENFDYLVIVQERRNVFFLVTAFHVDGDASRNRLKSKYDRRLN